MIIWLNTFFFIFFIVPAILFYPFWFHCCSHDFVLKYSHLSLPQTHFLSFSIYFNLILSICVFLSFFHLFIPSFFFFFNRASSLILTLSLFLSYFYLIFTLLFFILFYFILLYYIIFVFILLYFYFVLFLLTLYI